jgi:rod shape determining protein RodA
MLRILLGHTDWLMHVAIVMLLGLGLSTITSTTIGTNEPYAANQFGYAILGVVVLVAIQLLPYQILCRGSLLWYGLTIMLLALVLALGRISHGAESWLSVGTFTLQPSELTKVSIPLVMAMLVDRWKNEGWTTVRFFLSALACISVPVALVLLQPDLGTATVMGVGWLWALWLGGLSWVYLVLLAGSAAIGSMIGWNLLASYQRDRLLTFIQPMNSPLGAGYNVIQSIIAVGSGQLMGRGWGRGTQSHLNFLPEHHTDFIYAALSEELGFWGSSLLILAYVVLIWRCLVILWGTQEHGPRVLVGALIGTLTFQAGINIAMNIGLAPVTGIPLPLVSYGGSSLITTMLLLGIIANVGRQQRRIATPG